MEAIILAADNGIQNRGELPKCLMEIDGETILEQGLRKLSKLRIDDVSVVIGDSEAWSEENRQRVEDLGVDIFTNSKLDETSNAYSFCLAAQQISDDSEILVLNGDIVFDIGQLESMTNSRASNIALCRPATSVSDLGGRVKVENGMMSMAGTAVNDEDFPWYIYGGIAKLNSELVDSIVDTVSADETRFLLDILGDLASEFDISITNTAPLEDQNVKSTVGGSYANIELKQYIRKQATGRGSTKLKEEIEWLLDLPEDIQPHFPTIRDYNISDDDVWMEQSYHDWPSLRDLLFHSSFTGDDAKTYLDDILRFSFESLYNRTESQVPDDFLQLYHFDRVWYRLYRTQDDSPMFNSLLEADTIRLDGEKYFNLPALLRYLEENSQIRTLLSPGSLSKYGHFDLHFQNILVDEESTDFMLVDPRGYEACDPYYDLGKMYHSVNGLYDFIDTCNFAVDWSVEENEVEASLDYLLPSPLTQYREIRSAMPEIFAEYIDEDPQDIMVKVRFNELMHFSSLIPFHLVGDGKEQKGVAFYLTAVKLANEFIQDYGDDFQHNEWVDINTIEQYEQAKKWQLKGE